MSDILVLFIPQFSELFSNTDLPFLLLHFLSVLDKSLKITCVHSGNKGTSFHHKTLQCLCLLPWLFPH